MDKFNNVIFVCNGNTCRSPMAATILSNLLEGRQIVTGSRGMVVLFPEPYNPRAIAVAASHNMIMPSNNAQQIQAADFGNDTLILVMNQTMKQKIYHQFSNAINVFTLSEFAGEEEREVPDPYGRGIEAYNSCFEALQKLTEKAAQRLLQAENDNNGEEDPQDNSQGNQ